jgi:hypothetical protein
MPRWVHGFERIWTVAALASPPASSLLSLMRRRGSGEEPQMTHDSRDREPDARLGRANEQIDRLREATDRSGNVVQFRMARYLESLLELVDDLNERSRQMPLTGTYERRTFERDLGSLEDQVAVTFAEFASATAEEQGDAPQEMRADIRLLEVEGEAGKRWWRRMFRGRRVAPARSDPEWEVGPDSTDKGGGARGTKI